jgi:hypothetical protein
MKLAKETRKRLLAGEDVELTYPAAENPPFTPKARYSFSTGHLRIVKQLRVPEGWKVLTRLDTEHRPRFLDQASGYTDNPARAVFGEPEGPPKEYEDQLAKDALENSMTLRTERRLPTQELKSLGARLDTYAKVAASRDIDISSHVRTITARLEKIGRILADGEG